MLRWRLIVGIPLVVFIVLLCWLDAIAPAPGIVLMPFFLICVFFLCKEILALLNAGGVYPRRTTIYAGVFGTIVLSWFACYNSMPYIANLESKVVDALQSETSNFTNFEFDGGRHEDEAALGEASRAVVTARRALDTAEKALDAARMRTNERNAAISEGVDPSKQGSHAYETVVLSKPDGFSDGQEWKTAAFACVHVLMAIAFGVLIAFVGEMLRFEIPGGHLINLSGAIFAIVYIGLLGSFMVVLRIAYGIFAVFSMALITKMCDVGAYTVGRLIGRHKMAPKLSPGKTIEGAIGGMAFAVFASWLSMELIFPLVTSVESRTTWLGIVIYGLAVGCAGALGDLAESLVKRDVGRKDSGDHVPGFGGFLDIFDSLLLAAPVAFGLWAFHVVG
ncbi:MAG: phosphatidate cytidylyltransferase [Thermoguttaceae bacterium]|jgi:CDP-diglyceride synthetase